MKTFSTRQLTFLLLLWFVALIFSGAAPKERLTWCLEVFPVLFAAPVLFLTREKFPLPRFIYLWIFVHGIVLMIGGHYTYAEVPLGFWVQDFFHLSRNHYDRLGHFLQGFVPALIAREILVRHHVVNGKRWVFFITTSLCISISVLYEFIEWGAALILDQGADAFLGSQGDQWDTQWDIFLATIGAGAAQIFHSRHLSD